MSNSDDNIGAILLSVIDKIKLEMVVMILVGLCVMQLNISCKFTYKGL